MTVTLCIETSGAHCSLALAVGEHIYSRDEWLERSHNLHLLPLVDALFAQAGLTPAQLDLAAFGCGPGSFTGVRIAAAACQAMALAADVPVVPLPSALAWALSAQQLSSDTGGFICSIRSRGDAHYLAAFACDPGGTLRLVQADELCTAPPVWLQDPSTTAGWQAVGTRPDWWPAQLRVEWLDEAVPRAADSIPWVRAQHVAGCSVSAELALPLYISGDSPWKKRDA